MASFALTISKKMITPANSRVQDSNLESDEALVVRAKAGDRTAFESLFLRHRDLVYRFSFNMVRKRDDAEDIVQDVFVRAYNNLDRYRDEAKFSTWLLRIASNLCTDKARMHNRRNTLEQQEAKGALGWMTENENEDPIENLEGDRRIELLKKALMALPEHHRSMIVMRDIEEKEYSDIAEICGTTVGGAKLRVLRARRALRDRMEPLLKEDENV
jgi:RNA polymerase sigma-70 factor (ECF subfamily)